LAGDPLRIGASLLIRAIRPIANPALYLYAAVSPEGDRRLLTRPEFGAMFLDDLLNGSRKQLAAPFNDVILFTRDWGFRLDEVKVPVRWWHGDSDHIVPFAHGEHVVSKLADCELFVLHGESHLGGLGRGEEILSTLTKIWDEQN
jgi:pimeloyl-ACP methyl ester carboxylesterase